jgi:hypothetical protein
MNSTVLLHKALRLLGATVLNFGLHAQGPVSEAKLAPSDPVESQQFGAAVAVDGDIALMGAPADCPMGIYAAGSAYVFTRSSSGWSQKAKLLASDFAECSQFGCAVAASGDTLVVGAGNDAGSVGAVYVFTRNGNTWTQQVKLTPTDPTAARAFGSAVALEGEILVAGAPADAEAGANAGAAYVFVRNGTTWSQQAKLLPAAPAPAQAFGSAVAVSGNCVAVGIPRVDEGVGAGSVQVFVRSGDAWLQQAELIAPEVGVDARLGWSVAVEGETILAGAPQDSGAGLWAGAAYLFTRNAGTWSLSAKLTAEAPQDYDFCGNSVGLRGGRAVVGAANAANLPTYRNGAAHLFQRSGSTWTRTSMLRPADNAEGDQFGFSLAVSATALIVGTPYKDLGWGQASGAAYAFDLPPLVSPNHAPIADASATATEARSANGIDASVVLDGSKSSDPDGDPLTYAWSREGAELGSGALLTVSLPLGSHQLTLVVSDGVDTAANTVTVNVVSQNRPPLAEAGPTGLKVISPNNRNAKVTLDGSQSSDPDGDALRFQWLRRDAVLAEGARVQLTLPVGLHCLTLRVTDGQASATDNIAVRVITAGEATRNLMKTVHDAELPRLRERTLLGVLCLASSAFDHGHMKPGTAQLLLFQRLVQHRDVKPIDARTAKLLIGEAQKIVDAVAGR